MCQKNVMSILSYHIKVFLYPIEFKVFIAIYKEVQYYFIVLCRKEDFLTLLTLIGLP
jgi:hypothetical protein